MLMANAQKKWQVFNLKTGKWNKLKKGAFKAEAAKGSIIRIVQPNGGFATIANAEKLPKGVEARFSQIAADRTAAK